MASIRPLLLPPPFDLFARRKQGGTALSLLFLLSSLPNSTRSLSLSSLTWCFGNTEDFTRTAFQKKEEETRWLFFCFFF